MAMPKHIAASGFYKLALNAICETVLKFLFVATYERAFSVSVHEQVTNVGVSFFLDRF